MSRERRALWRVSSRAAEHNERDGASGKSAAAIVRPVELDAEEYPRAGPPPRRRGFRKSA